MAWHSWQLQEPVSQVSEGLKGLKGASASFGPIEKERLGLPQLAAPRAGLEGFGGFEGFERSIRQFRAIVWQLQEPVRQVSEGLDGLKEASGIVEPIKTKDVAVWQLQELQEPDKMKSAPKVVPGAAPAMPRTSIPPYLRNSSLFKEFLLKIPP